MTRVASYDVFDTVLTRLLGGPHEVFVESGRRLREAGAVSISAAAYAAARQQVGSDLTPDVARHPPLEQVCEELASRLGPPVTPGLLLETELGVERDACRAVPGAVHRVEAQRRSTGRGVVYVSDTSLPEQAVRELLEREGLYRTGDELWTSAGCGASKQDGGLYDVVVAAVPGRTAAAMQHTGDDRWSDLAHARLHGWQATLDTRAHLTARERALDAQSERTDGAGSRLAGASRAGRLQAVLDGVDPALAGIAGAVALPLLAGFATWVLAQARELALDRLYFVARDGEVFLEVARQLGGGSAVSCHYLHGSRQSWQLAAIGTTRHQESGELWVPDDLAGEDLTAREVLALTDLPPDEAHRLTDLPLLAAGALDLRLGADGWVELREALASDPLRTELRTRARDRRDLLVRYLDEQAVTAPGRVGLVDVGWTGRAARALEEVLVDAGRPLPAAHLFLGVRASAPEVMGPDLFARAHGWLLDEARGRPLPPGTVEDPVMLVESFAMGREGHTVGYALAGDAVAPVLVADRNPAAQAWDLEGYRHTLACAVAALAEGPPLEPGVDLRPLVWRQLLAFWRAPTAQEAAAWGVQPYGEDFHNATAAPLAAPVTVRRLLTRAGIGDPAWRQPTYWVAGTVALSRPPLRPVMQLARRLLLARGRLRRLPRRLRAEAALRRRD